MHKGSPECKDRLHIMLPQVIHHTIKISSQVIFTCSQHEEILVARCFKTNGEVKDAVKQWSNGLAAEVCDKGIQKLITCYDKCLNDGGDYVEK